VREIRFNVFGRLVSIVGAPGGWTAYLGAAQGKRSPADFIVPDFLEEDELCQYLADLFHEMATPTNGDVFRIPHRSQFEKG
jgi:hypothetical protein